MEDLLELPSVVLVASAVDDETLEGAGAPNFFAHLGF